MSVFEIALFIAGGFLAGVINTLAGNGSSITLSLLIFLGLPADVANATNRIGALVQTITATLSLKRSPRTRLMFVDSYWYFLPSVLGSVLGAWLAIDIDPQLLRYIIGFVMLLLLISMLNKPGRWLKATDRSGDRRTFLNWFFIFLTAVYAGFIQMGMGIILLSILVLFINYSMRDANIIKLVLSMIFVIPAFFIFLASGDMLWLPGISLAIGQAIGAVIGARYILFLPNANVYMRWLLIVILSVSAVALLNIPQFVINWIK